MFGLGKKKETEKKDNSKLYNAGNKAIEFGAKVGMQDAMQQAFLKTAPSSFENMINNLTKKMKQVPTLDECKDHLHRQSGFMSAVKMMGIDSEVLDGILEDSYNKVVKKN
jgi:hypothetical protein